jgi:hypothetical protein
VCGVGGTGVVTVAALLGLAAHGQGVPVTVFDQVNFVAKDIYSALVDTRLGLFLRRVRTCIH